MSEESLAHRARLPVPHPLPFILARYSSGGHRLIAPWPRRPHGELTPEQADQLAAVRERLASADELPALAWVTAEAIIPITEVGASWLARKQHDGQVVAIAA